MVHPRGSFCFAELHTPDMELGKRFYSDLLGWNAVDISSAGGYAVFRLDRAGLKPETTYDVAGLRRTEGPHVWIACVSVESVDRTAERARQLGATVVTAPFDTPGLARTCVLADPQGAEFGLWEAHGHDGADVQDQTGAMWWVELLARDVAAARHFYTSLFGWSIVDRLKYAPRYTVFKAGGVTVGGAVQFEPDWGVSPRWQVYFAVDDFDATLDRARVLGGTPEFDQDVPNTGRLCVIRDPRRAVFVVMQPKSVA